MADRNPLALANDLFLLQGALPTNGKTLRGREQLPPRWKRCTNDVDNDLGEALGQAYVAKYFSPEAKLAALKIVKEVEAAMHS